MTKFSKLFLLFSTLFVAGLYFYKSEQTKQLTHDGGMALFSLVDQQGWASMSDQLAAVNRGTIVSESKPLSRDGSLVMSQGLISISDLGLCKEVIYSWPVDDREQPQLLSAVDCQN